MKRTARDIAEKTKRSKAANDATRRDWGNVNPVTRVIPDKRGKKAAKDAKREMRDC